MQILREYWEKWKGDYDFRTLISASGSFAVTKFFALYNGYLGIHHSSKWHGTICVYYMILAVTRGMILISEKRIAGSERPEVLRRKVLIAASVWLLILNISLVIPITLMVRMQKPVNMTLIPAIAMAGYTTYKVTMASCNLKWKKKATSSLVEFLRDINFIDALVSILTLQNTLIMVNSDGESYRSMLPVTAVSSAVILLVILAISVYMLVKNIRSSGR